MELKAAKALRIKGIEDLARFAASHIALGQPAYILHFKHGDRHIYGTFLVYHDYYNLYGVPLFYYYESLEEVKGRYLLVKAEETRENVVFSDGVRAGWIAVPIVNLMEKPDFINL